MTAFCWDFAPLYGQSCVQSWKARHFAGGGVGDGGPATAAALRSPNSVFVDSSGDVFIADSGNNRVRKVDGWTGTITTIAGNGSDGFSGDGGPATAARLSHPNSVFVDSFGDLFIADEYNHRVRKVDAKTGIITTNCGEWG